MFGQVPLHLTTTRTAMLKNTSLNHAYFQVNTSLSYAYFQVNTSLNYAYFQVNTSLNYEYLQVNTESTTGKHQSQPRLSP